MHVRRPSLRHTVVSILGVSAIGLIAPGLASAQSNVAGIGPGGRPIPVFSSGCSGAGPGTISGRVPNYTQDTMGYVRIVPGDADGDAFVSELTRVEASKAWLMKTFDNPKNLAAFEKHPVTNPAADTYNGSLADTSAVMAYLRGRTTSLHQMTAAVQSAKQMMLSSDGGFTCSGISSGKYHVVVMLNHIPRSAVLAGTNATGISQTTLESDVTIPPAKNGQKIVVPVTQYRELSSLKK